LNKLKPLLFFIVILFSIIIIIPKSILYYKLEDVLSKQKIYINGETTKDIFNLLYINKARIYYEDIKIAHIQEVSLNSLVFFNNIKIKGIKINKHLKQFIPREINDIKISYHIFSPTTINISSIGKIGELTGKIDLLSKTLFLLLKPSKIIKTKYNKILSLMKKNNKGGYIYEYKFR
jgi:hypothetical protein